MKTIALALLALAPQDKAPASSKDAIKKVQFLVGSWKVTMSPEGAVGDSWEEVQDWQFKFDKEVWALQFTVKDGKRVKEGILGYDLKKKVYTLTLTRPDDKKASYEGPLKENELALEETVAEGAKERITYQFLRDNRFIGKIERKDAGAKAWTDTHGMQFTKQGVPFVRSEAPKCVVTGGAGTIEVSYQGKTYYVC